jgi:hypothetical protein
MNYLWKSIIIVFLFLVGTAFLFTSHANRGDNLAGLVTRGTDSSKTIPAELEGETVIGLPMNGEARPKGLPVGLWGGEHISMQVTDQHTTIEYDCAHGTIDQRIALDRRGRFNVSGMQVQERGGPARQDGQLGGYPVRFSGQVNGKTMKLSVRNSVTKELIGDFTLILGSEPKLRKCL